MKKGPLLLFLGLLALSLYIIDQIYYIDKVEFLPPVAVKNLRIRDDRYGNGNFGTGRRNGRTHKGIDILAPIGTPVRAAKSGWAIARLDKNGYGRYVEMHHKGGLMTLYAHLKNTNIRYIKKVRQGDIIGWVGKTGNARYKGVKPHLHFELKRDGIHLDPKKEVYIR